MVQPLYKLFRPQVRWAASLGSITASEILSALELEVETQTMKINHNIT